MCASTPHSAPRTCEYGLCTQHDCLHATGTDLVHQRAGNTAGNACLQRCLRCWGLQQTPGAKAKQGNLASVCGAWQHDLWSAGHMYETDKPDTRALAGLTWLMDTALGNNCAVCCLWRGAEQLLLAHMLHQDPYTCACGDSLQPLQTCPTFALQTLPMNTSSTTAGSTPERSRAAASSRNTAASNKSLHNCMLFCC
jgi:hypothetical protein